MRQRARKFATIRERCELHSMPEPNSGCHLWLGAMSDDGYGRLGGNGRMRNAPRLLWIETYGPLAPGLVVRHKCDVRACVNIDHLCVGTVADNNNDRDTRGRHVALHGEKNGHSKITSSTAVAIFLEPGKHQDVAWKFNVSKPLVQAIKSGRLWQAATKPYWSLEWRKELEQRKRPRAAA